MSWLDEARTHLGASMRGADTALSAADRLCRACVELLEVDGAAVSLVYEGATRGTFGSSGDLSRRLDELQFTFGEGPCLDSVRDAAPVFAPDLEAAGENRWPGFRGAVLEHDVRAVFALPVALARMPVGALDLFCHRPGPLAEQSLLGGLLAAELAALPLLEIMQSDLDVDGVGPGPGADGWDQLASLERVEVYQATGMIMGATGVGPTEALLRLRACSFARGVTASEAALQVVSRRLIPEPGGGFVDVGAGPGSRDA